VVDPNDLTTVKFFLLHREKDPKVKKQLVKSIANDLKAHPDPNEKLSDMISIVSGEQQPAPEKEKSGVVGALNDKLVNDATLVQYQKLFNLTSDLREESVTPKLRETTPSSRPAKENRPPLSDQDQALVNLVLSKSPEDQKKIIRCMELQTKLTKEKQEKQQSQGGNPADPSAIEKEIRHLIDTEELANAKQGLSQNATAPVIAMEQ
jgi:hypothetical protein